MVGEFDGVQFPLGLSDTLMYFFCNFFQFYYLSWIFEIQQYHHPWL